MNAVQMAQQIKYELQQALWDASDATSFVFGSATDAVSVMPADPGGSEIPDALPAAIIQIAGGSNDENDPQLATETFVITIAAECQNDPLGEASVIGGPTADFADSAGKGVGEVAAKARGAIANLTSADGARINLSASGSTGTRREADGSVIAIYQFSVEAICTVDPHYEAPQNFKVSGGVYTWSNHCAGRFDFVQYVLVDSGDGDPPASATDGTVRYTGTAATTSGISLTGTAGIFAQYNSRDRTSSTIEASSDSVVGAYIP